MQDRPSPFDMPFDGLDWPVWRDRLSEVAGEDGFAEILGDDHTAVFIEDKPVLLVTFESFDGIRTSPIRPTRWAGSW